MIDSSIGRRKSPRKIISVPGRIRTGQCIAHNVAITDLSEGGCCAIDRGASLKEGATVTIRVGRLDPIEATVRWARAGEIGLEFQRPIYGPVFNHIRAILNGVDEKQDRRSWLRPV
ncbi:MAG: PilZ domain-containing protein [Alphaproteobacteria bacterium]|nr:PilZ domain-containing protein [Alphaproteobacteria bacterium]MBU1605939.1 PilZ domain-containing protein [Alphaproteobacteria bacterium]